MIGGARKSGRVTDSGPESGERHTGLAALIEANVTSFLLGMGGAGGGQERSDAEAVWTVGGSPIGYHNAVVDCDVAGAEPAREVVGAFLQELRTRRLPGSWHLTPAMRPEGLREMLHATGFRDGGEEPAMAADLCAGSDAEASDLVTARVADAEGMREYRDVLAAGFGEGPKEADWVAGVFSRIGFDGAWVHFVGRVDATPVATASLLLTPPVGGIYFVCTRPEERRRGYGAAVTRHAMSHAAAAGASHAVLGSSPMGQRIYEGLGFRTVFSYRLMDWEP